MEGKNNVEAENDKRTISISNYTPCPMGWKTVCYSVSKVAIVTRGTVEVQEVRVVLHCINVTINIVIFMVYSMKKWCHSR
jgi:hypothetical protein